MNNLISNSLLNDFSKLLAQKNERDRLKKKFSRGKNLPATKVAGWNIGVGEGEIFRVKPPGWKDGNKKSSARVLAGPTSKKVSTSGNSSRSSSRSNSINNEFSRSYSKGSNDSTNSNQTTEDLELLEEPLEEEELDKAIRKLFRNALLNLRTSGHIILAVEDELEELEMEIENLSESIHGGGKDLELESLSTNHYDPNRINKSTYNLTSKAKSSNGFNLNHFVQTPPKTKRAPGAGPYDLIEASNSSDNDNDSYRNTNFGRGGIGRGFEHPSSATPKAKFVRGTGAPYPLIEATSSPVNYFSSRIQSSTAKNSSTATSVNNKKFSLPPPPSSSPVRPSINIRGNKKGSNDSRTDSIYEIETEYWILITPYLLNKPLLKIIDSEVSRSKLRNQDRKKKNKKILPSELEVEGIGENQLINSLKNDSRWENVAKNDIIIQSGIEDLIERDLIKRRGSYLVLVNKY